MINDNEKLYIKIKDGEPYQYPILESNLIACRPGIDLENLPEDYAVFERADPPTIGPYQELLETVYIWKDDIVTERHVLRDFNDDERQIKIWTVKNDWATKGPGYPSWTFDESLCTYVPPVPYPPEEYKPYRWDERSKMFRKVVINIPTKG